MNEKNYRLTHRFKMILEVLYELGKGSTTREIAKKLQLSVGGTSRSLKVLRSHGYVEQLGGKKGCAQWKLVHNKLITKARSTI